MTAVSENFRRANYTTAHYKLSYKLMLGSSALKELITLFL